MTLPRRRFLHLAAGAAALPWSRGSPRHRPIRRARSRSSCRSRPAARRTSWRASWRPMRHTLGQPVVIENVTGAGSTIGTGRAVQAPPGRLYPDRRQLDEPCRRRRGLSGASGIRSTTSSRSRCSRVTTLIIVGRTALPVNNGKELMAWLKANPDKATGGARRRRQRRAHLRHLLRAEDRHALPSCRTGAARPSWRISSRTRSTCSAAKPRRCCRIYRPARSSPSWSCRSRGGAPLPEVPTMEELGVPACYIAFWHGHVGAEGHAEGRRREDQRRGRQGVCRSGGCIKRLAELGQDLPPRDAADAAGACRLPQVRDRQVVADHQGGEYPGELRCVHEAVFDCGRARHFGDSRWRFGAAIHRAR